MDNELLLKLIQQHNRLILPSLGALLRKENALGESFVFSPFLKKDDGVLNAALRNEYSLSEQEADSLIQEYVLHIQNNITKNGKFEIPGIGMLSIDSNGAITLIQNYLIVTPAAPISSAPSTPSTPSALSAASAQQVQAIVEPAAVAPVQPVQHIQQPIVPPLSSYPAAAIQQPVPQPAPQPPVQQPVPQPVQRTPQNNIPRTSMGIPPQQGFQPRRPINPSSQINVGTNNHGGYNGGVGGGGSAHSMTSGNASGIGGTQCKPTGAQPYNPYSPHNTQNNNGSQPSSRNNVGHTTQPLQPTQPTQSAQPTQSRKATSRPKQKPAKSPTDIWLVIAIVAAVIVLGLMVYGFLSSNQTVVLDEGQAEVIDTTVVIE